YPRPVHPFGPDGPSAESPLCFGRTSRFVSATYSDVPFTPGLFGTNFPDSPSSAGS
ncbi:hypothetical protein KI387_024585, partial [Taxus chinensis]